MPATPTPHRNLAKTWDEIRVAFQTSIMIETSLSSLAQNLDGPDWPLKGRDETPSKYLDMSYEELCVALIPFGKELPALLVSILKDTLAFDDPFGDMVAQSEASVEKENPLFRNLQRLGIPQDFPLSLTQLSKETHDFCKLEKITTLGEFAKAAQKMAATVVVGGDFRQLLNAIAAPDEKGLAQLVPFRPGSTGLHLLEALAQCVQRQPPALRAAFVKRTGIEVPATELAAAEGQSRDELTRGELSLRAAADLVVKHFEKQFEELRATVSGGSPLDRHLVVLGNPVSEAYVAALLEPRFRKAADAAAAAAAPKEPPAPAKKGGLFGALSKLFGR